MSRTQDGLFQALSNECDMLQGNIARVCVTDDLGELRSMAQWVKQRMDEIYKLRLLRIYNDRLARYQRMTKWCETASQDEQLQQEAHIQQVIDDCNNVLNEIRRFREVTDDEVLQGFEL